MSKDTSQIWYAARHWRLGFFYVPSLTRHWSRLPNLIIGRTPAHDSSTAGLEPTTLPSRVLRATLTRPLLFYGVHLWTYVSCISFCQNKSDLVRLHSVNPRYLTQYPPLVVIWTDSGVIESERILYRKPTVIFEPASNFQVVDFLPGTSCIST